jgi:hypothetical protein
LVLRHAKRRHRRIRFDSGVEPGCGEEVLSGLDYDLMVNCFRDQ